jgi:hypothetical protein
MTSSFKQLLIIKASGFLGYGYHATEYRWYCLRLFFKSLFYKEINAQSTQGMEFNLFVINHNMLGLVA